MEVVFQHITERIIKEIRKSVMHLQVCVAWLTNRKILEALIEHSKELKYIEIIVQDNEDNRKLSMLYNQLIANDAKVYFIKPSNGIGIIHHKFCIIDEFIIINGSFNWSENAQNNHENITIIESQELASQYSKEFKNILVDTGVKERNQDLNNFLDDFKKTESVMLTISPLMKEVSNYIFSSQFDKAWALLNGIELMWPKYSSRGNIHYFKHLLHCYQYKPIESYIELIAFLKCIAHNDVEKLDYFKDSYKSFISFLNDTHCEYMDELNVVTKENTDIFKEYEIIPHVFSFNDWSLPF